MCLENIILEIVKSKTIGTANSLETKEIVDLVNQEPKFKHFTYSQIRYVLDKLNEVKKLDKAKTSNTIIWSAEFAKRYLRAIEDFKTNKTKGIDTLIRINKENGVIVERYIARKILEKS